MSKPNSALFSIIAGAIAMGGSVVFVRLADVGPITSAFWRVFLALPFLYAWMKFEDEKTNFRLNNLSLPILSAGLLFAGDLIFWHLAIMNTSVANATFMATTAPVWVILLSGLILSEPASKNIQMGLIFCICGGAALIGSSAAFKPENLIGDVYGLITACFFAGYFLAVRMARRKDKSSKIMFETTVVTSILLAIVALILEGQFLPTSVYGFSLLIALAFTAHVLGQGLLTIALGHLPATFSSLVIFLEAIAAAVFGWMLLGESLNWLQLVGGSLILFGIFWAKPAGLSTMGRVK